MPVRSRLRVRKGLSDALSPFCVPPSQPQSLRDSPFQGHTGHSHRSGRVPSLLRCSSNILLTRAARRLKPPCLLLYHGCTGKICRLLKFCRVSRALLQENCSRHPHFSGYQEQFRYVFALGLLRIGEGDNLSPSRDHAEISARKSFRTYRFP